MLNHNNTRVVFVCAVCVHHIHACVCTCACVHTHECGQERSASGLEHLPTIQSKRPSLLLSRPQDCCSCCRDGTVIQTGRSRVWHAAVPQLPGSKCCEATTETYLPQAGLMFQCCDRQAMLVLEMGILVAVLAAGSAGQNSDRREAGSSCYGGFDLYFVLDK